MKSFSKWTIEEVEDTFGIEIHQHSDVLSQWVEAAFTHSDTEHEQIQFLQERLQQRVWDWNEEELKVYFIIPLLNLVNFNQQCYQAFLSRELSMTYGDKKVAGSVDFVVAAGKRSPKHPYFFIHEYKKEYDSSNDPLGQLMIAMVTAQQLNNDEHAVYGAYVMGRYWHFVVLKGKDYAVHTGFNAADNEIYSIFSVLKQAKCLIEEWI